MKRVIAWSCVATLATAAAVYAQVAAPGQPPADVLVPAPPMWNTQGPQRVVIAGPPAADEETAKLFGRENEINREIGGLAAQYKDARDQDVRDGIGGKIEKLVAEQFTLRQELRAKQLELLESQVKRLRKLHVDREEQRGRIVSDRVRQLLREAEGLGWGDGAPSEFRLKAKFDPWNGGPGPYGEPMAPPKIIRVEPHLKAWGESGEDAGKGDDASDEAVESRSADEAPLRERRRGRDIE